MLKTWEGIKSIININTTKNKSINCLSGNDIEETDPFVLSSSFNKVFTTIAEKIESNIVHTPNIYTDYLTNPSEKTFVLTPTSPDEVEDIIKTLNQLAQTVSQISFSKNIPKILVFQSSNSFIKLL